jgi:hypothetical protein
MIVVDSSAVDALRQQEEARKAREDRMRNALEILSHAGDIETKRYGQFARFVRATAREGLRRETE